MAIEKDKLVLIVDDDTSFCNVLKQMIFHLGIRVEITSNPLDVLDLVRNTFFNLVLLDIKMPKKSGVELLPEIIKISPDTKIIVISGFGDKNSAISALKLGAFDFLEKPFEYKMLSHSINRAIKTQKIELLCKNKKIELQDANKQLMENNKALSTLAKNIEQVRSNVEASMEKKIKFSILPIIDRLQQSNNVSRNDLRELKLLRDLIADLTSTLSVQQTLFTTLTPTESRIALLIENGLTTNEIAIHMRVSPETVKSHRKNIRKKLGINKFHYNLRTYIQSGPGNADPEMRTRKERG